MDDQLRRSLWDQCRAAGVPTLPGRLPDAWFQRGGRRVLHWQECGRVADADRLTASLRRAASAGSPPRWCPNCTALDPTLPDRADCWLATVAGLVDTRPGPGRDAVVYARVLSEMGLRVGPSDPGDAEEFALLKRDAALGVDAALRDAVDADLSGTRRLLERASQIRMVVASSKRRPVRDRAKHELVSRYLPRPELSLANAELGEMLAAHRRSWDGFGPRVVAVWRADPWFHLAVKLGCARSFPGGLLIMWGAPTRVLGHGEDLGEVSDAEVVALQRGALPASVRLAAEIAGPAVGGSDPLELARLATGT